MRDAVETLDVVVRGGGLALSTSSSVVDLGHMVLLGTLLDSDVRGPDGVPTPVSTAMNVFLSQDLVDGAHVQRESDWTLETEDGFEIPVSWMVEGRELPDGYALQDARARAGDLEIRAFALEDLVATVGVGLAAGIAALALWSHHKQTSDALRAAERQYQDCLRSGGLPTIMFGMDDEASLTPDAKLRIKGGAKYTVRCAPKPQ